MKVSRAHFEMKSTSFEYHLRQKFDFMYQTNYSQQIQVPFMIVSQPQNT